MARYTGAVCKLCRREGMKLFLKGNRCQTVKCAINRRNQPPGVHPWNRPKTDYAKQLREKQKVKRYYGVLDQQFRKYFNTADQLRGDTGENLLKLLESRLDNVLKRLNMAASNAQARQLIVHGHITVNGKKVDRPSFQVSRGDVIGVKDSEKSQNCVKNIIEELMERELPTWLSVDADSLEGRVVETPTRDEVPIDIRQQLVVELMSK